MTMEEKQAGRSHKLVVNNRKTSLVTGVLDVLSFDLNEILLETEQGMLMVKGSDLHVIDSMSYSEVHAPGRQSANILSKLFR